MSICTLGLRLCEVHLSELFCCKLKNQINGNIKLSINGKGSIKTWNLEYLKKTKVNWLSKVRISLYRYKVDVGIYIEGNAAQVKLLPRVSYLIVTV